jgi:hypothetical protein
MHPSQNDPSTTDAIATWRKSSDSASDGWLRLPWAPPRWQHDRLQRRAALGRRRARVSALGARA